MRYLLPKVITVLLEDRKVGKRIEKLEIGRIYIIKNSVNNKVYIGLTTQPLEERFNHHLYEGTTLRSKTKLYCAMNELGIENFYIEELTTCRVEDLPKFERAYIEKYNSYYDGYNSTLGGEGLRPFLDDNSVNEFIKDFLTPNMSKLDMAVKYDCSIATICRLARLLKLSSNNEVYTQTYFGPVIQYDRYFKEILNIFDNEVTALEYLRSLGSKTAYTRMIEYALKTNRLCDGYRWQPCTELLCTVNGQQVLFYTTIDKDVYLEHPGSVKLIQDENGYYHVEGMIYADYVGETARGNCEKCGKLLNKENRCIDCDTKIKSERQSEINKQRIEIIKQRLSEGKNLSEIGRELDVSSNWVKKLCQNYSVDYTCCLPSKWPRIYKLINKTNGCSAIMHRKDIFQNLSNHRITTIKNEYNFYTWLEEAASSDKIFFFYKVEHVPDNETSIDKQVDDRIYTDESVKQSIKIKYTHNPSNKSIIFSSWDEVYEYVHENGLSTLNKYRVRTGIMQSIKIRNGRRFGGTWEVTES